MPEHNACKLNPEPYAYEEGFAVQRLIVAQINHGSTLDPYANDLRYPESAPWVDWGPYLWANGPQKSPGNQLFWCDSTTRGNPLCQDNLGDFRFGDETDLQTYWGDHTHPTYKGQEKVAHQLVKFINGQLPAPQTHISDWVTPWKGK